MLIVGLLLAAGSPVMAQPADKIRLFVEARSEGQGSRDEAATRIVTSIDDGVLAKLRTTMQKR
jgi:hypothetical protein